MFHVKHKDRLEKFLKVLRVLRFLTSMKHRYLSTVSSIPGLRPAPSPRGYAFYLFPTLSFSPLELPPLPSAPPPMGRYYANASYR